jgi:tight adherence protein B
MILIVMFVGILLLSFLIIFILARPSTTQKTVQERLRSIEVAKKSVGPNSEPIELSTYVQTGFLYNLSEHLQQYHFTADLQRLILHSGSKSSVGSFAAASAGLAVSMGFLMHIFGGLIPLITVASVAGGAVPYAFLRFQKSRRLKAFNTALPDGIELMARALRAGHSMSSSIEIIAEQSVQPLASEFETVYQQQKFGIPFRDALLEMGGRVPSKDLHFLITAVLVQKETGGDLTEILDRTTHVIRERVRIEGEVRTHTAQGRLTGWILSLLPVIMLGLINVVTPGYSYILFHDPLGQKMLYAGVALIIVGSLIIRKIVDIEV